jgi:hypothetical protein
MFMKLLRDDYPMIVFVCLSIAIHACIFFIIVQFQNNPITERPVISFEILKEDPQTIEKSAPVPEPETKPSSPIRNPDQPELTEQTETDEPEQSLLFKPVDDRQFIIATLDTTRKTEMLIKDTTQASDYQFQLQLFKELHLQKDIKPGKDRMEAQIDARNHGGSLLKASDGGMFSLSGSRTRMRGKPRFDFIPTETEAKIIAILSDDSARTTMDIYRHISIISITLGGLEQNLKHLFDKGLLIQKKVSPENKFNFFGIGIELSNTNRKNPVYEYTLRIERTKMIAWVESHQLWLEDQLAEAVTDTTGLPQKISGMDTILSILRTWNPND